MTMAWNVITKKRSKILALVAAGVTVVVVYTIYLISGLPSLEQLENPKPELTTDRKSVV